jgi:hypothetical protein
MYNWNIDTKKLKEDKEKYTVWKLEQLINYGLNGEKIDTALLKKYWKKLELDPKRQSVLKKWIW